MPQTNASNVITTSVLVALQARHLYHHWKHKPCSNINAALANNRMPQTNASKVITTSVLVALQARHLYHH